MGVTGVRTIASDRPSLAERFEEFRRHHAPHSIQVDGVLWTYFALGAGERCLLLLPGAIGGGELFFPLLETLPTQTRWLAASPPSLGRIDDLVKGLLAILDAEGVARTDVLGASFGGFLAQTLLHRHPERVRRVILSHSGPPAREWLGRARVSVWLVRWLPLFLVRAALRAGVGSVVRRSRTRERYFWASLYRQAVGEVSRELVVTRYQAAADFFETCRWVPEDLADRGASVLIIESTNDPVVDGRARARLKALYPAASVHTFHGTGHASLLADPEGYAAAVHAFLA